MICYRDRTYCDAPCVTVGCDRMATPEVEADAKRIGLLLSLADLRDVCDRHQPKPDPSTGGGT